MNDPWAFGWTQLLTIIGMVITVTIAIAGFRSFGRWRREQIEARKIELSLEALSLAYESKAVFGHIRTRVFYKGEGADVPEKLGESPELSSSGRRSLQSCSVSKQAMTISSGYGPYNRNSSPYLVKRQGRFSTNSTRRGATSR